MNKYVYNLLILLVALVGCSPFAPMEEYNEGKMVFNQWSRNAIGVPAEVYFHSTNGEFTLVEIVYPIGSATTMSVKEFQELVLGQARAVFGYKIPIRIGFLFTRNSTNLTAFDAAGEEIQKTLLELSLERDFVQITKEEWDKNFRNFTYVGRWNFEIWYWIGESRLMRRKENRFWKSVDPIELKVELAEPVAGGDAAR